MPMDSNFTCAVCGYDGGYEAVRETPQGTKKGRVLYYRCQGCTVHFDDVEAFSATSCDPPNDEMAD